MICATIPISLFFPALGCPISVQPGQGYQGDLLSPVWLRATCIPLKASSDSDTLSSIVWGMLFCSWRLVNEAELLTLIWKKCKLVLCKTSLLKLAFMQRIMPMCAWRHWHFRPLSIFWIVSEVFHQFKASTKGQMLQEAVKRT